MAHYAIKTDWTGDALGSVDQYSLSMSIRKGDLELNIDAPFYDDAPPIVSNTKIATMGLWDYELVEVFIASGAEGLGNKETPYIEIGLGPRGHWYMLSFQGEQEWESRDETMVFERMPIVQIDREKMRWSARVFLPFFLLPEPGEDTQDALKLIWKMNFCAIHGNGEKRKYLSHAAPLPGTRPNFHQLSSFVPLVLSDADSHRLRSMSRTFSASRQASADSGGSGGGGGGGGGGGSPRNSPSKTDSLVSELQRAVQTQQQQQKQQQQQQQGERGEGDAVSDDAVLPPLPPAPLSESITETLSALRIKYQNQKVPRKLLAGEDVNKIFARHLHKDELMVIYGLMWKRKGWSHKHRILILTTKPRLLYIEPSGPNVYKGSIAWTMAAPISITKVNEHRFDIELADKSRVYHWFDDEFPIDKWIDAIEQVNNCWASYLRRNTLHERGSIMSNPGSKKNSNQVANRRSICVVS